MTSPSAPASASERLQAVARAGPRAGRHRGAAAAERRRVAETWAFTANGEALILRRDPPGRPGAPGSMRLRGRRDARVPPRRPRRARSARRRRRRAARHRRLVMAPRAGETLATPDPARRRVRDARASPRRRPRPVPRRAARDRSRRSTGRASTPTRSRSRGPHTSNSTTSARRSRRATPGCAPTGPAHRDDDRARRPAARQRDRRRARPRGRDRLGARPRRRSPRGPRVAVRQGVAVRRAARGRPASARSTSWSTPTNGRAARGRPRRAALVARREDVAVGHRLHGPGAAPTSRARSVRTSWPRSGGGSPNRSGT